MQKLNTNGVRVLLLAVLIVVGCAEEEGSGDDVVRDAASTATSDGGNSQQEDPTTTRDVTTTTIPPPTDTSLPETTDTSLFPADASFCESLEVFFEAWALFLQPADLTPAYETLGELAPPELVNDFAVLAEGNAILVATLDRDALPDPDGYDASGARVAAYAVDECGIDIEEFQ